MKVICFDFDDVIADGNLLVKALEMAGDKGLVNATEMLMNKKNLNPRNFYKTIRHLMKLGRGMHFKELRKIILGFRLMKNTGKTFHSLKKMGYTILIISVNDSRLIHDYLKKHRLEQYIDQIYGSTIKTRNEILTGEITGDVLKGEKTAVLKKIEKTYKIKRKDVVYVADGLTDLPLMKIVGKGILFCPNALTKIEIFASRNLMKRINSDSLFIVEKKDMREILGFV